MLEPPGSFIALLVLIGQRFPPFRKSDILTSMWTVTSFLLILFLGITPAAFGFAKKPATVKESVTSKKYACPMQCLLSEQSGKCSKCGMEMWEVA